VTAALHGRAQLVEVEELVPVGAGMFVPDVPFEGAAPLAGPAVAPFAGGSVLADVET
jgi:hypothetical protein